MAKNNFNTPLLLINKKPHGEQMLENGYGFYMYPSLVIKYANETLSKNELNLYLAISGQAEKDRTGQSCHWAIKHYCEIAGLDSKHYQRALDGLCNKGFIIHKKFESIEVLYPISKKEFISSNGTIRRKENSQNGNNEQKEPDIEKVHNSKNGKNATDNKQDLILPKKEEESQKRNQADKFGNNCSQNYGNNRETNINKEIDREYQAPNKEQEFEEKTNTILEQIGNRFNITSHVFQQAEDLKAKGFSNEFIFYALDNKRIEDFSKGIGLLFLPSYQNEIKAKIEDKRAEDKKMEEQLNNLNKLLESDPNIFNRTRQVRVQKITDEPIKQLVKTYDFSEMEWEDEEEKKNPFADLI